MGDPGKPMGSMWKEGHENAMIKQGVDDDQVVEQGASSDSSAAGTDSEDDDGNIKTKGPDDAEGGCVGFGRTVLANVFSLEGKQRDGRLYLSKNEKTHCGLSGSLS